MHTRRIQQLNNNPDTTAEDWFELGNAFHDVNDVENARYCFVQALDLEPTAYMAAANAGVMLSSMGDHAGAIAFFERALAIHPDYGNGWYNLGYTHQLCGKHDKALEAYMTAVRCSTPPSAPVLCSIGYAIIVAKGDIDTAKAAFNQGIWLKKTEDDSANIRTELLNYGHAYLLLGDEPLAVDKYQGSLAECGDFAAFEAIFTPDIPELMQAGIAETQLQAVLAKVQDAGVGGPRPLDKTRFVQLVKAYLTEHCEGVELRDQPDGVYVEAFGETVMRWRYEHAWERYTAYRVEWELVGYGLARSYRENTINRERVIPQVIGREALGGRHPDPPVFKKYSEDLYIYFVEDRDERVRKLDDAKYFNNAFLDWERDYAEALDRLKGLIMDSGLSFADDGLFFNRVVAPNYASALILWAGLFDSLPFHDIQKDLIIGIPERDTLYYKDNNDPMLNLQFDQFIRQTYAQSDLPVSPHLFVWRSGRLERFMK
jgi:tetratricopeptide (TPR) repeat protein